MGAVLLLLLVLLCVFELCETPSFDRVSIRYIFRMNGGVESCVIFFSRYCSKNFGTLFLCFLLCVFSFPQFFDHTEVHPVIVKNIMHDSGLL